uniref:Selenoprotein n=1 Tax=Parastrongyloides trichosuri TaxID=131310 RepID=A0A0N4ZK92_PARTI
MIHRRGNNSYVMKLLLESLFLIFLFYIIILIVSSSSVKFNNRTKKENNYLKVDDIKKIKQNSRPKITRQNAFDNDLNRNSIKKRNV